MRRYELLIAFPTELQEGDLGQEMEKIKELIRKNRGRLIREPQRLGVKKLFHPIKHQKKALFFNVRLEIEPSLIKEIDNVLKYSERVLRYFLTKQKKLVVFKK